MRYCPQCGQRVEDEDAFCFECGEPLDGGSPGDRHGHGSRESVQTRAQSPLSVGAAAVVSILGLLESLVLVFFPGALLTQAEEFGLEEELTETVLMITGGIGLVIALGMLGLSYYYYSQGYVDRQFFWVLTIGGVLGFLLASMVSFLILVAVGIYGLWKIV